MERRVAVPHARRAFTVIELMVVFLIILTLIGLTIGGIRFARSATKATADRADAKSLKDAVLNFQREMGFFPPLVADFGDPPGAGTPLVNTPTGPQPLVFSVSNPQDLAFLRTSPPAAIADLRFSLYTLPYYVIGALDFDGQAGPGFRAPRRDGSFNTAGRVFAPFFDISRRPTAVFATDATNGRVVLRDRNGVAYRYYHWEHGDRLTGQMTGVATLNVPLILGDPTDNPELSAATYAIVGAGPNGLFGNEDQLLPGHPQHLDIAVMAQMLGISGDPQDPNVQAKIRSVAISDNIVELIK